MLRTLLAAGLVVVVFGLASVASAADKLTDEGYIIAAPPASATCQGLACADFLDRNTIRGPVYNADMAPTTTRMPRPREGCVLIWQPLPAAGTVYPGEFQQNHRGALSGSWERASPWVNYPVQGRPNGGFHEVCKFGGGLETFCSGGYHHTRRGGESILCGDEGYICRDELGIGTGD
jgi:hypothetical protein